MDAGRERGDGHGPRARLPRPPASWRAASGALGAAVGRPRPILVSRSGRTLHGRRDLAPRRMRTPASGALSHWRAGTVRLAMALALSAVASSGRWWGVGPARAGGRSRVLLAFAALLSRRRRSSGAGPACGAGGGGAGVRAQTRGAGPRAAWGGPATAAHWLLRRGRGGSRSCAVLLVELSFPAREAILGRPRGRRARLRDGPRREPRGQPSSTGQWPSRCARRRRGRRAWGVGRGRARRADAPGAPSRSGCSRWRRPRHETRRARVRSSATTAPPLAVHEPAVGTPRRCRGIGSARRRSAGAAGAAGSGRLEGRDFRRDRRRMAHSSPSAAHPAPEGAPAHAERPRRVDPVPGVGVERAQDGGPVARRAARRRRAARPKGPIASVTRCGSRGASRSSGAVRRSLVLDDLAAGGPRAGASAPGHGRGELEGVLELAHVARPLVREQHPDRLGRQAQGAARARAGARQEQPRDGLDVLAARAERRHLDREDAQPVVEVLAEAALRRPRAAGSRFVAAMMRAVVRRGRLVADALVGVLLEHAQQLHLQVQRARRRPRRGRACRRRPPRSGPPGRAPRR